MGLKEVWGFDPDEAKRVQGLFRSTADAGYSSHRVSDERTAHVPPDAESKICELCRIFSLNRPFWCELKRQEYSRCKERAPRIEGPCLVACGPAEHRMRLHCVSKLRLRR